MPRSLELHPDRLLPAEPSVRALARALYADIADLPIVSPHGHTDPRWFADNAPFGNATDLLLVPDHYVFRMLYSQGVALEDLGVRNPGVDPRAAWLFAERYPVPGHAIAHVARLGLCRSLRHGCNWRPIPPTSISTRSPNARDRQLPSARAVRPLWHRSDRHHRKPARYAGAPCRDPRENARAGGWQGRVITAYRPDPVVDPEFEGFSANLDALSALTGEDCRTWRGYLAAHRQRRAFFAQMGATSTDHGHPTAQTANLSPAEAEALFDTVARGAFTAEAELFRAQMLTEMAAMSCDDGLVMQIHPGSFRNHNAQLFERLGRDKGADIPTRTDYVHALKPLLDRFGNARDLSIILFTLDESAYARELAPLAGHYPCLKLGPAWWFHDSPEGMRRFRLMTTETAGFYNTVGFNDDTRAFLSIPARHDVARRIDCGFLAQLVAEHRIEDWEAAELARDLTYNLAKRAYKL
jgi:glucuronate isomerase